MACEYCINMNLKKAKMILEVLLTQLEGMQKSLHQDSDQYRTALCLQWKLLGFWIINNCIDMTQHLKVAVFNFATLEVGFRRVRWDV